MTTLPAVQFDPAELGPAMRRLSTDMQRAFVAGKVMHALDNTNAARFAGYEHTTAAQKGWALAHREDVQAAIEEECRKLMRSEGPKSVHLLAKIRDDEQVAPRDRIKAATELLNRGGLHARTESNVNVSVSHMSEAEQDAAILKLLVEGGVPIEHAKKLLIDPDALEMTANKIGIYELAKPEPEPVPPEVEARRTRDREKQRLHRQRVRDGITHEQIEAERIAKLKVRLKAEYAEHQARRAAEEAVPEYVDINLSDDDTNPLDEIQDIL